MKSSDKLPNYLLEYRNTPLPNIGYSPSQLLLNRMVKAKLPIAVENLLPKIVENEHVKDILKEKCEKIKKHYDKNVCQVRYILQNNYKTIDNSKTLSDPIGKLIGNYKNIKNEQNPFFQGKDDIGFQIIKKFPDITTDKRIFGVLLSLLWKLQMKYHVCMFMKYISITKKKF